LGGRSARHVVGKRSSDPAAFLAHVHPGFKTAAVAAALPTDEDGVPVPDPCAPCYIASNRKRLLKDQSAAQSAVWPGGKSIAVLVILFGPWSDGKGRASSAHDATETGRQTTAPSSGRNTATTALPDPAYAQRHDPRHDLLQRALQRALSR
jgi:hypothetical protein